MKKYTKPAMKIVEIVANELMSGSTTMGKASTNASHDNAVLGKGMNDDDWDE